MNRLEYRRVLKRRKLTKWEGIANNKRIVEIDEEENTEENETGFYQNCI